MDYYMGEIRLFAGVTANRTLADGWVVCDGRSLNIQEYPALYSLIGTIYGGDGITTFKIPDLRGRLPIGQGQGTGLTQRVLAQTMGTETVNLQSASNGTHTHALNCSTNPATGNDPGNTFYPGTTGVPMYVPVGTNTTVQFAASAIGIAGASAAHTNMMPNRNLNFIIALNGLYPQRQQ